MPHARPITVRNPGTGEVLGEVPALTAAEVDAAVTAAGHAQRRMIAMPAHERSALLLRVADLMAAELDDLGRHLAGESTAFNTRDFDVQVSTTARPGPPSRHPGATRPT